MKLVVMIPAYNEEDTIGPVISEIPRKIDGIDEVEVVVVNDGSTDKTSEAARKADRIIEFSSNRGLALAFKEGLNAALDGGADVIVNTDADGQYNAEEIPKLIKPILEGKADIVLGSRFDGRIEYMPIQKRMGNKIVTSIVRFATGQNISDAQTGFRAFSRDAALRLVIHTGYTYTQETIIQATHKRMGIVEVPVEFRKRNGNSRLMSSIFSYAKHAGVTLIRTYTYYNPLKTFTLIGGWLVLFGLILGLRVLVHYVNTGMVTPYLPTALLSGIVAIIGFQVIVMGLLADIEHQNRHIMEEILYRMRKNGDESKRVPQ